MDLLTLVFGDSNVFVFKRTATVRIFPFPREARVIRFNPSPLVTEKALVFPAPTTNFMDCFYNGVQNRPGYRTSTTIYVAGVGREL